MQALLIQSGMESAVHGDGHHAGLFGNHQRYGIGALGHTQPSPMA